MFNKDKKQKELHKDTVNKKDTDSKKNDASKFTLDIYRDVYSKLCDAHDKNVPFIDAPKMNKKQIVLEEPTKFLPNVECVLKYNKDKHSFTISDVLPLLQLVQDEANEGVYVDDVKASEVADLIKSDFHNSVKVSYPQINDPWTTFPRNITIQNKDDVSYSSQEDFSQVEDYVESFINGIKDVLKDIKQNKSKYLVIRKISNVNLKNEMSN